MDITKTCEERMLQLVDRAGMQNNENAPCAIGLSMVADALHRSAEQREPTMVIRSDDDTNERLADLEALAAFFADDENWLTTSEGFAAQYDPAPSPAQVVGRPWAKRLAGIKQ